MVWHRQRRSWARAARLGPLAAWLVLVACAGCRSDAEPAAEPRRPYAAPSDGGSRGGPRGSPPDRAVQIRNSCPEAVVVAISAESPSAATPTITLGSTKVEALTVPAGARVWLRYDGRWDPELSVAPRQAIEVGFQCNGIYESDRGR